MHESWLYRKQLAEFSASFKVRARRQIWRDDSLAKAEWMFFVGFFVVRKLIENRKVTDACRRMSVSVDHAPISRKYKVSDFDRHKLEGDLDSAVWSARKIDVAQLADKVIHTWWLALLREEDGGHGGYIFTTDRDKDASFLRVSNQVISSVFSSFADGKIKRLSKSRDIEGKLTFWKAE